MGFLWKPHHSRESLNALPYIVTFLRSSSVKVCSICYRPTRVVFFESLPLPISVCSFHFSHRCSLISTTMLDSVSVMFLRHIYISLIILSYFDKHRVSSNKFYVFLEI
uniref:Uncharacterized protein n=1 Tax=Parascaris equorum TaxID=6256 RepID=A0A914RK57_PAREQ